METPPCYALIIPAHNEEEALGAMLDELLAHLDPRRTFHVVVGLNDTSDHSIEVISQRPSVSHAETSHRGYGHGCLVAMNRALELEPKPDAFIFLAADGANDPRDIPLLTEKFEQGYQFVMGSRTRSSSFRPWHRSLANRLLGWWAGALCGSFFDDLGPFRLLSAALMEEIQPRELTWGWTVESQILAVRLGHPPAVMPVSERSRIAGQQKVSGVSLQHSLRVGIAIGRASLRVARRSMREDG